MTICVLGGRMNKEIHGQEMCETLEVVHKTFITWPWLAHSFYPILFQSQLH